MALPRSSYAWPRRRPIDVNFEDFLISEAGLTGIYQNTVANSGTLADSSVDDGTCRGVASIATGSSSAAGRSSLRSGMAALTMGQAWDTFEAKCRVGDLSVSAQEFNVSVGFHNSLNAATINAVHGAWFRYHRAVDGDFWTCHTADNSDADASAPTNHTKTVTAVAPSISAFQLLRVDVLAGGLVANFYIDHVLVASHSTHVPLNRQVGCGARITKSNGTEARALFIDSFLLQAR